jgi:hypothetical protein
MSKSLQSSTVEHAYTYNAAGADTGLMVSAIPKGSVH